LKQTVKNKVLALLFVLAVLTPLLVQASHALERHEHVVCTAKDVKHFHADELDCLLCCTPIELNSFISFASYQLTDTHEFNSELITLTQLTSLKVNNLKSSRAPPSLLA